MQRSHFNLVQLKVDELIPYDRNSRTHNEAQIAQIAASIKEFGFTNPVLIDEGNTIIAGEGRVLAAKKLKLETVPCIVLAGLSEAQKAAYVIADNKLALNADWDEDLLLTELANLADLNFAVHLTGFSEVEVLALPPDDADALLAQAATLGTEPDWSGMPEFNQPNDKPFRSVLVHMNDQAAVDAFAKLISHRLTDKTKYLWYPEQIKKTAAGVVYA